MKARKQELIDALLFLARAAGEVRDVVIRTNQLTGKAKEDFIRAVDNANRLV